MATDDARARLYAALRERDRLWAKEIVKAMTADDPPRALLDPTHALTTTNREAVLAAVEEIAVEAQQEALRVIQRKRDPMPKVGFEYDIARRLVRGKD